MDFWGFSGSVSVKSEKEGFLLQSAESVYLSISWGPATGRRPSQLCNSALMGIIIEIVIDQSCNNGRILW